MAFDGFSLLFIQTGSKTEKQMCRDFLTPQGDGMQVGQQQQQTYHQTSHPSQKFNVPFENKPLGFYNQSP